MLRVVRTWTRARTAPAVAVSSAPGASHPTALRALWPAVLTCRVKFGRFKRVHSSGLVFLLLAVAVSTGWATAAGEDRPPWLDPTRGEIGGRIAIAFLPQETDGSTAKEPTRYTVHLAAADDLDRELVFPAAKWFQPPVGRYRAWLEGEGRISPESVVLNYSGSPFKGRGLVGGMQLVAAGTVRLADEVAVDQARVLRLLHLDSDRRRAHPQREISRRVLPAGQRAGALMPAGQIVAGLFDTRRQEYVGLTRPVAVAPGKVTAVRPRAPEQSTYLVALLERPFVIDNFEKDDVRPTLRFPDGTARDPDALVPTADRVYAIWYDLPAGRASLGVASAHVDLQPVDVVLRRRAVERLTVALRKLPALAVTLELPEAFPRLGATLDVTTVEGGRVAAQAPVGEGSTIHFAAVPAELVEITLRASVGVLRTRADLRHGLDGTATITVRPIELSGTVYRGRTPHPARIDFHVGDRSTLFAVETDDEGRYETVLFRSVLMTRVQLRGTSGPPFLEMIEPVTESGVLDFHLPATSGSVLVVDHETGAPITGAHVGIGNRYKTEKGSKTFSVRAVTNDDGIAELPPVHPGKVELGATAVGYIRSEPVRLTVAEEDSELPEVTIRLRRQGESERLRLVLADGGGAGGAELVATASLAAFEPVWSGTADGDGSLEVPRRLDGSYLLVRHPAAAFDLRSWQATDGAEDVIWTLPPRPSSPLVVRVVGAGGRPVPWAYLTLWLRGARLEGPALGWLTGGPPGTNADGLWRAPNVPTGRLELLAWSFAGRARANELAALAAEHPAAAPIEVQLIE